MLPKITHHYQTRNSENLAIYQTRTNIFKYSFFPYLIMEWIKLSSSIGNSTYPLFRNHLLKIIWSVSSPVYKIQNCISLKFLTRLRLGLSHLNELRFNHNFQNCINLLCTCGFEVESTTHFFLHCHHYHNIRAKLLNSLEVIDTNLLKFSTEQLTKVLLNSFCQLDQNQHSNILNSSFDYIVESKRFEGFFFKLGIDFSKFLFLKLPAILKTLVHSKYW